MLFYTWNTSTDVCMCLSGTYIKTNDIIRIFLATYENCTNSNETLQSWKKIMAKRRR